MRKKIILVAGQAPLSQEQVRAAMTRYRIRFKDEPVSPSPSEVWPTREAAEKGIKYYEQQFPEWKGKLKVVPEGGDA